MTDTPTARLASLGITLPEAPAPVAAYVPWTRHGDLLFVSGQVPFRDGVLVATGRVPDEVSLEDARAAARQCALNGLAVAASALDGDLDRVVAVRRLGIFVACGADFTKHPLVGNGASELMVEVFGDEGRHARAAVGSPSLPLGVPVEVEMTLAVR